MRQRCVAVAAVQRQTIVQTLIAFNNTDVGQSRMAREASGDFVGGGKKRIKVEAVAPTGLGQPHGINVVGALLKWLNGQTLG